MRLVILIAALTGIVSARWLSDAGRYSEFWWPGFVFGTGFGMYVLFRHRGWPEGRNYVEAIAFLSLSVLAYFIAIACAFVWTPMEENDETDRIGLIPSFPIYIYPKWVRGMIAGGVGAFIVAAGSKALRILPFRPVLIVVTAIIGALLGTLLSVGQYRPYYLFIPWQIGVALLLFVPRKRIQGT